jgi:hypothetical protein
LSNYLQRMAFGVLKPGGNIHPIMDSVLSTPNHRAAAAAPRTEETFYQANAQAAATPATGDAPTVFPSGPNAASPASDPQPVPEADEDTRLVEKISVTSHPPQRMPQPLFSVPQSKEQEIPVQPAARTSFENQPQEISANILNEGRETRRLSQSEESYKALIPLEFFSPESKGNSPKNPSSHAKFGFERKKPGAAPSRSPEPPDREPDEIQIHIGRIEVSAVQAAAPVASSARPQRSRPSLDDYLRRRDRRVW